MSTPRRFDRTALPSTIEYLMTIGSTTSHGGHEQRFECPLVKAAAQRERRVGGLVLSRVRRWRR